MRSLYLKKRNWQRYSVAFLSVAIALVIKLLLTPIINHESPFLLFLAAILISAWYGGLAAGVLATFLASLASDYFFLSPYYSFKIDSFEQILRLVIFLLEGLTISSVVAALKSAKRQAEMTKEQLLHHQEIFIQSQERHRAFIEQSSEGIWRFELEKPISVMSSENEQIQCFYQYAYLAECNDAMAQMYGFSRSEEIIGTRLGELLIQSDSSNIKFLRNFIASKYRVHEAESHEVDQQGLPKYFLNNFVGIVENNFLVRVWGTQRDITDQKQAKAALQASEQRFRATFNQAAVGIAHVGIDGKWLLVNQKLCDIVGYTHKELLELTFQDITHSDDLGADLEYLRQMLANEIQTYSMEKRYIKKDGACVWINLTASLVRDALGEPRYCIAVIEDISQRKQADEALKASLQEKEVLLKEIHHRVKNNLQIISSLINLQSSSIDNPQSLEILKSCENRVAAMALIHEQLYQSLNLKRINLSEYVTDLTTNLLTAYNINSNAIALNLKIAEVKLDIDLAIPCGLIINELVSNSLKYAFPSTTSGEILVQIQVKPETELVCTISDNGIGLPQNFDFDHTETLGLQLVTALTNQIGGKLNLKTDNGTTFQIIFSI